jgi:spermidine synthase
MLNAIRNFFRRVRKETVIKSIKDGDDTLSVTDNGEELTLRLNNVVYSRLKKKSIYTNSYWDYFTPLPVLYKNPKILMIGLGGGTVAYQLTKLFGKGLSIDIIEISEKMVELSKYFLPKKLNNINIIVEDGSKYVKRKQDCYDLLILDAYEGDHIPEVFLSEDFITSAYKSLKKDGIIAINYALNLTALVYLEHYLNKLRKLFKVYTINNPLTSGNMIIMGSKEMNRDEIMAKINKTVKENRENHTILTAYRQMT